jgi:hypothetical protein
MGDEHKSPINSDYDNFLSKENNGSDQQSSVEEEEQTITPPTNFVSSKLPRKQLGRSKSSIAYTAEENVK